MDAFKKAAGSIAAVAAVGKLKAATNGECVKVVVRCRPLNSKEVEDGRKRIVEMDLETGQVTVKNPKAGAEEPPKCFTFDKVFDWNTIQLNLYNETARPICNSVMEGYNGTIFAYGQTGTGKTHTMVGDANDPIQRGIIPNIFVQVFEDIAKKSVDHDFLVRASFLEIYNEEVRDLLAKNPANHLELKESPDSGVFVKDLTNFVVKSVAEINNVLNVGNKNRSVGATLMNQDSSRSHSIFTITIETSDRAAQGHIKVGKLNLVDLAGSERQSKTGATGDRLKEATKINMSLSALGNVISSLVDGKSGHIPYRDSKLTRLLQDSLGGNTKTVMVANMGPADYNFDETISTLRYANRAKNIKNKPKVNEDPKDAMLREFQEEILRLKAALEGKPMPGGGGGGGGAGPVRARRERKSVIVEKVVEKEMSEEKKAEIKAQMQRKMERTVRASITGEMMEKAAAEAAEAVEAKRREIEEAAIKEEEEKEQLDAAAKEQEAKLEENETELEKEQRAREEIVAKLKALEGQVMHGSENLMEKSEEQERLEREQEEMIQKQLEMEQENQRRIAELEESSLMAEEKYNSIHDEVEMKTKKIKKLWGKFQEQRAEIKDLQDEFSREREYLLDDIRKLTREIKLKNLVIDSFVPPEELVKVHKSTMWDESSMDWQIAHSQYAGNNVRMRHAAELLRQRDPSVNFSGDNHNDQNLMDSIYQQDGIIFNPHENLSNVFFSYKGEGEAGAEGGGAKEDRPRSARRRPESGSRAGSASRPKSSRPSSAKKRSTKDDPNSIGSLEDSVASLEDAEKEKEKAFPKARGLVSDSSVRRSLKK